MQGNKWNTVPSECIIKVSDQDQKRSRMHFPENVTCTEIHWVHRNYPVKMERSD